MFPALLFLKRYELPYNKVASAMATNMEFLKAVKADNRPVILSTAMCDDQQIWDAANIVNPEVIMHCVGTYPADESTLNLSCITKLIRQYAPIKIGYSGHESSVSPSVIAAALGAEFIERHITLTVPCTAPTRRQAWNRTVSIRWLSRSGRYRRSLEQEKRKCCRRNRK